MESSRDHRQTFLTWLDDFDATSDEDGMLAELSNCSAMLPPRYCEELGLSPGSTFRDAVRVVMSTWRPNAYAFPN